MEIRESCFDSHRIEDMCMGAGIVPISTDETGTPHLLLGRERWIPQWRGSCRWSGFEGARKCDEDVVAAASREFWEESMGVVRFTGDTKPIPVYVVACTLRMKRFWRRIVLRIDGGRRAERYHCTYVVPVPWDVNTPERFREMRCKIEHIDRLFQELRHTRPRCLGEFGEHIGNVHENEDGSVTAYKLACTCPCILRTPWSIATDNADLVGATFTNEDQRRRVLEWFRTRERLERALVVHPCVRVVRDTKWGYVQDVCIQRDFLEKDQIRWWSVNELNDVISERGQLGPERFRPYFLPVLQTILSQTGQMVPPVAPRCEPVEPDSEDEVDRCESPSPTEPLPE